MQLRGEIFSRSRRRSGPAAGGGFHFSLAQRMIAKEGRGCFFPSMPKPFGPYPLPAEQEAERLRVLRSYEILDTAAESQYDDIVALAAHICGVPLASMTLVDETRQWFKARVGLEENETPRDISFCAHAVGSDGDDLLIVPDAREDARFRDLRNVTGEPRIRFYAGAPLVTREGWTLGTLCVIDRRPRELGAEQQRALRVLRNQVMNALELRRLTRGQYQVIADLERTRAALDEARIAAEAGARAKSQFLAAMSHEIRTPMNAVIGMSTLIRATPLTPEQADYVDTIRMSGELLLTILNDILDFSKIAGGKLEFERVPFEVASCVGDAVDLLAAPAAAKGLSIRVEIAPDVPPFVRGDITRVRQILVNLLSNAVKFTPKGGITVSVTSRRVDADGSGAVELGFAVRDTGIGIPKDRQDRLFQPFCQAEVSTTRHYGGTGLGLAICKRLAEMHGGRMWVKSEPGRGSCFSFTVQAEAAPLATGGGRRGEAAVAGAGKGDAPVFDTSFAVRHPASILVAEDNQVNQKVVRRLLEKLGYTPEIVANGLEALVALRRHPFDLVLMDAEMPELDGVGATRVLRAELPAARQPVVAALTAHALVGDREKFLAAGMDDYLAKPLRAGELTALLTRLPVLLAGRRG